MEQQTKIPRAYIIIPLLSMIIALTVYAYSLRVEVKRHELKEARNERDSLIDRNTTLEKKLKDFYKNAKQAGKSFSKQSEVIANRKPEKPPVINRTQDERYRQILNLP